MKLRYLLAVGAGRIGNAENHRRTVLSNVIYLLTAGLLIFFLLGATIIRGSVKAPGTFGEWVPYILMATSILSIGLNALGLFSFARVLFTFSYMISIMVLPVLIMGPGPISNYTHPIFCIVLGLLVHLLFSYYRERVYYIFFLTCNLVMTVFSIDFLLAFDRIGVTAPWANYRANSHLINFICWIFVNVTLFYLLRVNWRFYQDLQLKHAEVEELNHALEKRVEERTRELTDRNEKLSEYAFMIAHILRAPISRIRGLLTLSQLSVDSRDEQQIKQFLEDSAKELDAAVHSISEKLHEQKKS